MFTIKVYDVEAFRTRVLRLHVLLVPDKRRLDSVLRGLLPVLQLDKLSESELEARIQSISVNGINVHSLCDLHRILPLERTEVAVELLPEDARIRAWTVSDDWLLKNLQDLGGDPLNLGKVAQHVCVVCGNHFTKADWSDGYALDSACCASHSAFVRNSYGPHNVWVEWYVTKATERYPANITRWTAVVKLDGTLYDMRMPYPSGSFISPHRLGQVMGITGRKILGELSEATLLRIWHERRGEWKEATQIRLSLM